MSLSRINSSALPTQDAVLRAIFSQITAEVRKTGRVLPDDEGSFYVSDRFTWKGCQKKFFDAYYAICVRKQITPIPADSKIETALKVPYAGIDTINLLYNSIFERISQFRERLLEPFIDYPDNPSTADMRLMMKTVSDDKDLYGFLSMAVLICEELKKYVLQLDDLVRYYNMRVDAFADALKGKQEESAIIVHAKTAKSRIQEILSPYIAKLKRIGVISNTWQYSFHRLPLTEDKLRLLKLYSKDISIETYWNNDRLPLKSIFEAERKRKEAERAKAEKERAEREKARKNKERKDKVRSFFISIKWGISDFFENIGYGIGKVWRGFNNVIEDIGEFFYYDRDRNTRFLIKALGWCVIFLCIAYIIVAWATKGFWSALGIGFLCFMGIGIYSYLEVIIQAILKIVFDIPQYILRIIFYRGWTFLLFLALLGVYLIFRHFLYYYLMLK